MNQTPSVSANMLLWAQKHTFMNTSPTHEGVVGGFKVAAVEVVKRSKWYKWDLSMDLDVRVGKVFEGWEDVCGEEEGDDGEEDREAGQGGDDDGDEQDDDVNKEADNGEQIGVDEENC